LSAQGIWGPWGSLSAVVGFLVVVELAVKWWKLLSFSVQRFYWARKFTFFCGRSTVHCLSGSSRRIICRAVWHLRRGASSLIVDGGGWVSSRTVAACCVSWSRVGCFICSLPTNSWRIFEIIMSDQLYFASELSHIFWKHYFSWEVYINKVRVWSRSLLHKLEVLTKC
jgi:hypothetical protein